MFTIREAHQESITFSPLETLYGINLEMATENLRNSQERYMEHYDRKAKV